jgi:DNA-binding IclR family transcriptional regulator
MAEKALEFLDFSKNRNPSLGLIALARVSGHCKATALQFLTALESRGFVEQHASSRTHHIGPTVLRFAVPYFEAAGSVCGAIAVAMPSTRVIPASEAIVKTAITSAARNLTTARVGLTPRNETEIMSQPDPKKEDLCDA